MLALWRRSPGFYVSSIVFGICLASIPAIMAAAVGDSLGGKLAPAGLGFIIFIFGIGQSLGPAVAGWLKDLTGTFARAFILSAAVSLLGAAGSILLRKKIRNSKIIQGQHGFMLIALYMVLRLQLQQGSGTWFRLFLRCRFLIALTVEYTF